MTLYDVVFADPPWSYYGQQDKWGAAAKFYDTHSDEALIDIARPPLTKSGIYFGWTTSAKLETSLMLLREWGLTYRGIAFVWVKTKKDGTPIGAQGVRPSITKPLTEFVVAGSKVAQGRPLKLHDESIRQTIFEPKREHSRKPDIAYEYVQRMYPHATKLEMFARTHRTGWDSHGNEIEKFVS